MPKQLKKPHKKVRDWISASARECRYLPNMADALAYNAWWLENRGTDDVSQVCEYLLRIHAKYHDKPGFGSFENTVQGLCPVYCGVSLGIQFETEFENQERWDAEVRTANPLLLAPSLALYLNYGYNVHLEYDQHYVVCHEDGIEIRSNPPTIFDVTNVDAGVKATVRLFRADTETLSFTRQYEKKETLLLPADRLIAGGKFRFD